ncbi:MAG: ACT domain-containing protein, partial [Deltaproteobacteria bacterium]|nr:ACT domain-containing protein [Deltaproteobacteria bacterium]
VTGVNERLVVTVLGPDRPGLVEAVSKVVEGHGGNWEASRMVRLAGRFAGVLLVTSSDDVVDRLATDLRALGQEGLQVVVERGDDDAPPDSRAMELELVGHDQPGIVRKVSAVLASRGVNIDELDSTCESAPMAGHNLFKVHAMVRAPMALDVAALRAELEGLAGDLMVDISLAESVES